jgi:deoxyribodipyrimidine photo-lyase
VAPTALWLRRDLRLADNPALLAAAADGPVLPIFVLDPALWGPAGTARRVWLVRSLTALRTAMDGALVVRHGNPAEVLPTVAAAAGARSVHVAADYGPYGRARDAAVERRLAADGVPLVRTGSPYAVAPGRLTTAGGDGFRVFSPFSRAWLAHGWPAPAGRPRDVRWLRDTDDDGIPAEPRDHGLDLPEAGEEAALGRWRTFARAALGWLWHAAGPAGCRRHVGALRASEVRRAASPHAARRHRDAVRRGRPPLSD